MAAGPALFCRRDAARQGMEACLLLCKQDLSVDLGRNEKATWEKCPRLRAEVGLARGVGQSEGHFLAMGCSLCSLLSSFGKTGLGLGGCNEGRQYEGMCGCSYRASRCFLNEANKGRMR